MTRQSEEKKLFTRRAFLFTGIQTILGITVVGRLSYLQLFKSNHYKLLSDKNRIVSSQVLPTRGRIFDCNGYVIATNTNSYSAILDLSEVSDSLKKKVVQNILKYIDLDDATLEKLQIPHEKINATNRFVILQENLNWDAISSFRLLSSLVPGINIEKNLSRYYTAPEIFSHVIGYVGSPSPEDIKNSNNTTLAMPMAKTGKCLLEKEYNDKLFGKAGIKHTEVNSRRQFVRIIDEIKSIPGEDIALTINKELQEFVYKRLSKEESGVCIVMDVNTGAILSFVSYPGYNTNIFNNKISPETLKELYQNPYKPMINKALAGLYSPGSTFKMITGLTGLHKGVINKHTRFSCNGIFNIGNYKYHCWRWRYGGHGSLNLQEAIMRSCDIFFYNIAMLLSPDDISEVARDFGLGIPTEIDIPGEKSGLMPTKLWKKSTKKQSWTKGDTVNMSIGQGFTLVTPIQLAKMISILVNGLNPITPYVCSLKDNLNPKKLKYKEEHIKIILEGMENAVNTPGGCAYRSHSDEIMFGGKTGSTQVFRITEQQRREFKTVSEDYWKKEHALFVGYAPVDNPRFAVCTLVEHGGWGAAKAAPIAKAVLEKTNQIYS